MDIKIDIKDDRHFTDVAPVVDREDFKKEIERIRSALGIKLPLSNEDGFRWSSPELSESINKEIEISRKCLLLPKTFNKVITAVVFNNEVSSNDYSPAYLDSELGIFNTETVTPDETFFIVISPEARDEDVLKELQKYRDQLGNIQGIPKYKYLHQVWEKNKKKPSIKKYRQWYLSAKSGTSIPDICEEETKSCPIKVNHDTGKNKPKGCLCFDESTIRKGIATYEALIWKTPTL